MDATPRAPRPRNRIDLTNQRFGELTARERLPKIEGTQGERWLCDCSCGKQTAVRVKDLTNSNTRSCGHLTGRARKDPEVPHRAADLYPAIKDAVWEALKAGDAVPHAKLRAEYRGRLSHGTYYRYVHRAVDAFAAREPA